MTQTLINQSRWDLKTRDDCDRLYQLNMNSETTFRRHSYLNVDSQTIVKELESSSMSQQNQDSKGWILLMLLLSQFHVANRLFEINNCKIDVLSYTQRNNYKVKGHERLNHY